MRPPFALIVVVSVTTPLAAQDWPSYGGDPGGARYSTLTQINKTNVAQLEIAWTYRTGDVSDGSRWARRSKFEATPILAGGTLYLGTPFNRVIALDPATGSEHWTYDPEIDLSTRYSEGLVSRGVSYWEDPAASPDEACQRTIFLATLDARLIALDARSGAPCASFGVHGQVDLKHGVGDVERGEYEVTSPPAVIGGVVVVGSALGDNRRVEMERGTVRAFDATTGELRWSWDPIPRGPGLPGWETWTAEGARKTGAANAWSIISADPERDLVFIPTGSAAPDYYGGERLGSNLFANSVVALRASTGEVVWGFQVVHHDLWDYDVASQPALVTVRRDGAEVPAVVVSTKVGHLFVLHRDTGEPLLPVEERPVPASNIPGEAAWPTQPIPVRPLPLHPHTLSPEDAFGVTDADRAFCREQLERLRYEGTFTPPSFQGTLVFPSAVGGTNWGGVAAHLDKGIVVTAINRVTQWVRLIARADFASERRRGRGEFTGQGGTPYGMNREFLLSPGGTPCNPPPWATLVAVDVNAGNIKWEVPLGVMPQLAGVPGADQWGSIAALGGPIATAGDLVFIGAAFDDHLRAFDVDTGEELWKGALPAGGQATPMTYQVDGRQFVVIAAGGHGDLGTTLGDYVVAFALP